MARFLQVRHLFERLRVDSLKDQLVGISHFVNIFNVQEEYFAVFVV